MGFRLRMHRFERSILLDALEKSSWELKRAASELGLPYATLADKLVRRHPDLNQARLERLAERRAA